MNDLMAIAAVRRMLMDLGADDLGAVDDSTCESIEGWICTANAELAGRTPLEVLRMPDGALEVARLLEGRLQRARNGR